MASTAWTKKVSIQTTIAGEGSNQSTVYLAGPNATKANIEAGGATADSAFADIGLTPTEINGTQYYFLTIRA